MLSDREAYHIASQWGSYMNDSDPGRVFYTFPTGTAQPQDEDHREDLIAYTLVCLDKASGRIVGRLGGADEGQEMETARDDRAQLANLLTYFIQREAQA